MKQGTRRRHTQAELDALRKKREAIHRCAIDNDVLYEDKESRDIPVFGEITVYDKTLICLPRGIVDSKKCCDGCFLNDPKLRVRCRQYKCSKHEREDGRFVKFVELSEAHRLGY